MLGDRIILCMISIEKNRGSNYTQNNPNFESILLKKKYINIKFK